LTLAPAGRQGFRTMAKKPDSFFGWLGRQIGYVKGATKPQAAPPKVLYQRRTVQESSLPDRPDEKLRRTVIDEVVRNEKKDS
jgi:hypothetical protein